MTDGIYLSAAAVGGILAGVVVLGFVSALVLEVDGFPERVATALFWAGLLVTWLVAAVAVVAIHLDRQ